MKIYFDNTASTPLDPEVISAMKEALDTLFGNPSSIHVYGRQAKVAIENSRRTIAELLNVSPSEIFFTSGGTEANNTAIYGSIFDLGIKDAITSPIEHHAVLHTLEHYSKRGDIKLDILDVDNQGHFDHAQLEGLLNTEKKAFVSLMHANNEISNLLQVEDISRICKNNNAILHSDMVQTMSHYKIDLKKAGVDFASCSAHKFHGPKGIGFLYINNDTVKIKPLIHGGGQERNMRGGTENISGIIGIAKAFEIAHRQMDEDIQKIIGLKTYMRDRLISEFPGTEFLGESADNGLYTVLNVLFPENKKAEMLIMNLDVEGIATSGGSACTSGASSRSHVLEAIKANPKRSAVRFSFSKLNKTEEIDYCIKILKKLL